jgi:hypothetical protein
VEPIKKLKSKYAYCLDERDFDGLLDCFTDDCKVNYGPFGKYENKKELEKFFKVDYPPATTFSVHMTQDPIIEINGDQAKGRWNMHAALTLSSP